jgi:hypothetical protein
MTRRSLESCDVVGNTEQLGHYIALLTQLAGVHLQHVLKANVASREIIADDLETVRKRLRRFVEQDRAIHSDAQEHFAKKLTTNPVSVSSLLLDTPLSTFAPTPVRRLQSLWYATPAELHFRAKQRMIYIQNIARDLLVSSRDETPVEASTERL